MFAWCDMDAGLWRFEPVRIYAPDAVQSFEGIPSASRNESEALFGDDAVETGTTAEQPDDMLDPLTTRTCGNSSR
jgi:hypothetical protein